MELKDYYKILGVPSNASLENIKNAYRKLSKKFHPDVNNGDKFFEEKFKEIQEAYEILFDTSKRKHYDQKTANYNRGAKTSNKEYEEYLRKKKEEFRKQKEDLKKREEALIQKEKKLKDKENSTKNKNQSYGAKYLIFLSIVLVFTSIYVIKNNNKTNNTINKETTHDIVVQDTEVKHLVTNNSVGFFKIGSTWHNIAKNDYNYQSVQGYGTCVDAGCDGGFYLGNDLVVNEHGWVENPELTIGASIFKISNSYDDDSSKYKNNKDVFYVSSENLRGWYWKDKISYLVIYSETYKTKEGIGVGTTLEELKEIHGSIEIKIGWLEEDVNAVQVSVSSYPDIIFILDVDDAIGGYDKLSTLKDSPIFSDFKRNTKIKRLIINSKTDI